jgi:hypothetical protein
MPPRSPPPGEPGTLTSLLNEVFRGSDPAQAAWVDGLAPGSALGRYDLIREVGRGGSGVVWEARDRELGRRVAVKVMRARHGAKPEKRLVAEAEIAARLSHPGIVTILDVGRSEKGAWLVQEFLVGRTLASKLDDGPLPLREALALEMKVASALSYAHGHGVVHRDLTPSNVFLCEDGQVKLLDLGMAQAFGRRKLDGGTPDYMAPEQAQALPEDERVDVYALGVLLYRMLTGRSPFRPETPPDRRLAPRLQTAELPGLGALVDQMLATAPGDRPRDASAVLAELEALDVTLPRTGSKTGPAAVRVRKRWPRGVQAAAGLALVAVVGIAGIAFGRQGTTAVVLPVRPVAFGGTPTSNGCQWGRASWTDLDRVPQGAEMRNGEMGGQGIADVGGRRAWMITSDWGHILLPLGIAAEGDPFAVEAEFFMPPVTGWMRGANVYVFTDYLAAAPSPDLAHGIMFTVAEEPGKPPWFAWHQVDAAGLLKDRYLGTLPGPVSGKWHTLRIEGSRSKKWYRGLLDGRPLVVAYGDYDLSGTRVALTAGYGFMNPEDVAFSNLRTFAGTAECQ